MISLIELKKSAAEEGIPFNSVEKDYVLGWTLWGIANHPILSREFVFKGGTALRKCYFERYRFSEDLDFTVRDATLDQSRLETNLDECAKTISQASGIEMSLDKLTLTRDEEGEEALKGKMVFAGPSKPVTIRPAIKLDITYYEKLVLEPEFRPIIQRYSDAEETTVQVYRIEEIISEKMRSMLQQLNRIARPRDWYDVWYLLKSLTLDLELVNRLFDEKCIFKGVAFNGPSDFFNTDLLKKVAGAWENSLKHQVKEVPSFKTVEKELEMFLRRFNAVS